MYPLQHNTPHRQTAKRTTALFTIVLIAALLVPILSGSIKTQAVTDCSPNGIRYADSNWLGGGGVNVCNTGGGSANYVNNVNGASTFSGYKWECVELVNRLYLLKGWTTANWNGNGNTLVNNVPSGLTKQNNGAISYINAGDVITLNDNGYGHAAIINSFSGTTANIINQNTGDLHSSATITSGSLAGSNATLTMTGWDGFSVQAVVHAPSSWGGVGTYTYRGEGLASGATLYLNQYLTSANVQHALVFQADRNLVLYNQVSRWQAPGAAGNGDRLVMQTDGNLVMYRQDNSVAWQTNTPGNPGAYAVVQSDGNFVVYSSGGSPLWSSGTGGNPTHTYFGSNTLSAGQQITQSQYLRSSDSRYAVIMQSDGNALVYGPGYHVLTWQTGTAGNGDRLVMQTDGNLVLYAINTPKWSSQTSGTNNYAVMQTDGNFVVYSSGGSPLWQSGTSGQI